MAEARSTNRADESCSVRPAERIRSSTTPLDLLRARALLA
jgi:hypothetical protein